MLMLNKKVPTGSMKSGEKTYICDRDSKLLNIRIM